MKYIVTICKEILYDIHVRADNEDEAVEVAEKLFTENPDCFVAIQTQIESCDIEEIEE